MEEQPQHYEDLQLLPGQSMQLAIDGYSSERGKTMLLGHLAKHSIMITAPVVAGVPTLLNVGTGVTVRMFVPRIGSVCAFRTEVMHAARVPFAHLYLVMPKDIVIGEVRRSVRANVSLAGEVFIGKDFSERHEVVLNDLSVGGSCLLVKEPLVPTGETVLLRTRIVVEGIAKELKIEAIVRAADYHEEKKTVSLQFSKMSEDDRIALYAYVMMHVYQ